MKARKSLLVFVLLISGIMYYSCDDSGTLPPSGVNSGKITFNDLNFKPLDQGNDGLYQLWLYINDSLGYHYKSLGKFNVLDNGNIVDPSGQALTFGLGADTNNLAGIKYALVTIEAPGQNNTFPGPAHLIAGPVSIYLDSLGCLLTAGDTLALGSVGTFLQSFQSAHYMLNITTQTGINCRRGLWFCDASGIPSLSPEMNLTPSSGWVYEGWVEDNDLHTFYSTGRFYTHNMLDADGAGSCAGTIPTTYNAPGQEWAVDSCSTITTLTTGHHGVFISIEPAHRTSTSPFFIKVYEQNLISTSLDCGRLDNIFGMGPLGRQLPKARMKIIRSR